MVFCILSVTLSAYMMALPFTFLAARPTVCVKLLLLLKNPSLSASTMATRLTSGRSKPSRRRFTPISTSNSPFLKSCMISTRSKVSTSLWMYLQRTPILVRYLVNSSAIRLVSVVTKTRSSNSSRFLISSTKSSI